MSCEARTIPVTTLNPDAWLAGPDEPMEWLRHPLQVGEHTVYTEGHIMLLHDGRAENPAQVPEHKRDRLERTVTNVMSPDLDWQPLDIPAPPEPHPCGACDGSGMASANCRECDGDGEVELESDYHTYHVECRTCGGDGGDPSRLSDTPCSFCDGNKAGWTVTQFHEVQGLNLQWRFLSLLYDHPGIEVAKMPRPKGAPEGSEGIAFRQLIDGHCTARGVIMALRA